MNRIKYCPAVFSIAAKACLLSGAILALSLALVEAGDYTPPPNWNVSGEWQLSQKAEKLVTMKLNQSENKITGTASSGTTQGKVSGYVSGDDFGAVVTWVKTPSATQGSTSRYTGTINQEGIIKGRMDPDGSQWRSESFASLRAMKRFQPVSTGTATGSGPATSAPTKTSTGATGPTGATGSTSTPTASPADDSSSSDSEDSHKKHKKKHKHRHPNEEDEKNQDNS